VKITGDREPRDVKGGKESPKKGERTRTKGGGGFFWGFVGWFGGGGGVVVLVGGGVVGVGQQREGDLIEGGTQGKTAPQDDEWGRRENPEGDWRGNTVKQEGMGRYRCGREARGKNKKGIYPGKKTEGKVEPRIRRHKLSVRKEKGSVKRKPRKEHQGVKEKKPCPPR